MHSFSAPLAHRGHGCGFDTSKQPARQAVEQTIREVLDNYDKCSLMIEAILLEQDNMNERFHKFPFSVSGDGETFSAGNAECDVTRFMSPHTMQPNKDGGQDTPECQQRETEVFKPLQQRFV